MVSSQRASRTGVPNCCLALTNGGRLLPASESLWSGCRHRVLALIKHARASKTGLALESTVKFNIPCETKAALLAASSLQIFGETHRASFCPWDSRSIHNRKKNHRSLFSRILKGHCIFCLTCTCVAASVFKPSTNRIAGGADKFLVVTRFV